MTEDYWANWKTKKDKAQQNILWKTMENEIRVKNIKDQHPDLTYSICRTDNNYWRHYRASTKLGIDELSMMICREVGCDLQYCQHLFAKPKHQGQQIGDCKPQFDEFRNCVVREKKIFRSIVGNIDTKENPNAIPEYLEKHFKEKEKMKKQRQMMGESTNDLEQKIKEMEERASLDMQKVSVSQFKNKKKQAMEESYM